MAVRRKGRSVRKSERPTYDRCAAAMSAGLIWSWSAGDAFGDPWLVKVTESDEWTEFATLAEVDAFLATLGVEHVPPVVAPVAEVAPKPRRRVLRAAKAETVPAEVAPAEVVPEPVAAAAEVVAETVATVAAESAGPLPATIAEYLSRLVYEPKRAYAEAYALHVLFGTERPADPGTEWADKARAKVNRLARSLAR